MRRSRAFPDPILHSSFCIHHFFNGVSHGSCNHRKVEPFQGPVAGPGGVSLVPDPWKPRVGALERALANTMRGNLTPREPRKRVLPPRKDLTGK